MASRARIVVAADETRRRIERDLHDGIQQRLVSLGLQLRTAQATVPPQLGELEGALARVAEELASVFDELREISHGIHPAILSEGGLDPALRALRRRSAVPVELDLHVERRLPAPVEVAAYYVVSEGLTNAAKHAHASVVNVALDARDAVLRLVIRDDGIGGADPGQGSGLVGLRDRIEALGGTLQVTSPAGKGTTLLIEVPLDDQNSAVFPGPWRGGSITRLAPQPDDGASLRGAGWHASRKAAAARRPSETVSQHARAASTTIGNYRICREAGRRELKR